MTDILSGLRSAYGPYIEGLARKRMAEEQRIAAQQQMLLMAAGAAAGAAGAPAGAMAAGVQTGAGLGAMAGGMVSGNAQAGTQGLNMALGGVQGLANQQANDVYADLVKQQMAALQQQPVQQQPSGGPPAGINTPAMQQPASPAPMTPMMQAALKMAQAGRGREAYAMLNPPKEQLIVPKGASFSTDRGETFKTPNPGLPQSPQFEFKTVEDKGKTYWQPVNRTDGKPVEGGRFLKSDYTAAELRKLTDSSSPTPTKVVGRILEKASKGIKLSNDEKSIVALWSSSRNPILKLLAAKLKDSQIQGLTDVNAEESSPAPKAAMPKGVTKDAALNDAKAAIANGQDRAIIIKRLKDWGIDASGL